MKLKRVVLLALVLSLIFSASVLAQDESFEFADYEEDLEEYGIPSAQQVEELKDEALSLYEDSNYEEAEEALEYWGDTANHLANIISQGLDPFYSASRSDRDDISASNIRSLADYEDQANNLKRQRNEAYYKRAESLRQIGYEEEAFALYQEVLGMLSVNEWDLWMDATNSLYEMVGVEPID